jgi:hypothetical protein
VTQVGSRSGTECLRRARDLLQEMDLEWDLAELDGLEDAGWTSTVG